MRKGRGRRSGTAGRRNSFSTDLRMRFPFPFFFFFFVCVCAFFNTP